MEGKKDREKMGKTRIPTNTAGLRRTVERKEVSHHTVNGSRQHPFPPDVKLRKKSRPMAMNRMRKEPRIRKQSGPTESLRPPRASTTKVTKGRSAVAP